MKVKTEIPDAVKICATCGDLATGATCERCRAIRADACSYARMLIRVGLQKIAVMQPGGKDPAVAMWGEAFESEFHRLRAAGLHSSLPSTPGLQAPSRGKAAAGPGIFETWGGLGVMLCRVAWLMLRAGYVVALVALLVWGLLL